MTVAHQQLLGPRCRRCKRDEATCARAAGCCDLCSHTFGEVVEVTEPRLVAERPFTRCSNPRSGTETGYTNHRRYYKTPPCDACLEAHRVAESARRDRRRLTVVA